MAGRECFEAAKEALEVSIDEGGAANAIILLYICMKQPFLQDGAGRRLSK